jgi:hypothetical protein
LQIIAIRETAKTCFLELKHEKDAEKSFKSAPATLNASDQSIGINSHPQFRYTVPLNVDLSMTPM